MKHTIESFYDGNLRLVEETLSDGSFVYNVMVGSYEVACEDNKTAWEVLYGIERAIKKSNIRTEV